jgi:hypothetical protein
MLAGSYAAHAYGIAREHGWWRLVPDTALLAMLPWMPAFDYPGSGWHMEANDFAGEVGFRLYGGFEDATGRWSRHGLNPLERAIARRTAPRLMHSPGWDYERYLALEVLVQAHKGRLPELPEGLEGAAVAAMMIHAYTTAEQYQDVGVMVRGNFSGDVVTPFATVIDRKKGIRFELGPSRNATTSETSGHNVWILAERDAMWEEVWPQRWEVAKGEDPRSRGEDAGPQFYSNEMASDMLRYEGHWNLFDDWPPVYEGVETVHGRPCHRLRLGDEADAPVAWVDAETYLVRRDRVLVNGCQTDYLPALTIAAGDHWLTDAAASPLTERMAEIDGLLPEAEIRELLDALDRQPDPR